MAVPFSLVIITLNEERNIERCIRSVPFADEVIVVDSDSADRTQEIARGLGARVINEKWRGFREQKTFAAAAARHDWILSLDADEALSPEAQAELRQWVSDPERLHSVDALNFPRLAFHLGRWIRHGGWYPDRQTRFYHRARAGWQAGHLHERVHADRTVRLRGDILHWSFADLTAQVTTNNRYSSLGAQDLADQGKKFCLLKLLLKPTSKFLETYVVKRGFLDGLPGFIISVGAAYSVFLKYAKLWERSRIS